MVIRLRQAIVAAFIVAPLAGCGDAPDTKSTHPEPASVNTSADQVLLSEEVIEGLRVPLADLSKSVLNLEFPDEHSEAVFEAAVTIADLAAAPSADREPLLDLGFERGSWPALGTVEQVARGQLDMWKDFLSTVAFFHHFKFYNVRGKFSDEATYHTDTGFKGLAQLDSQLLLLEA